MKRYGVLLTLCRTLVTLGSFLLLCPSARAQTAGFTSPDSICVNTPLALTNQSIGGTSYYWTFCVSDLNATPVGTNLGDLGGLFQGPAFMDFAEDNGTYYGYVVNNYPGALIQLNFGNSLLNTPTATSLGSLGGNLYNSEEGIQLVKSNGNWYAVIVGGTPASGGVPSVVTVNFGPSLGNTSPTSTNWGNIGTLSYPTCLRLVEQGTTWYGFTVNATNNTITRFDFGSNFNVAPTGVNLGNLGNLSQPTGLSILQSGGNWYLYLVNQTTNSITRFDFGSSLLNTPAATNLGNPGNALNQPRDITVIQSCGTTTGFLVNEGDNSLAEVSFPSGPASDTLTGVDLGNSGNLSFPQSISRIFQEGPDQYLFVTNITNNSVTRYEFNGCDNSTIPPSTLFTPPPVTYTTPGLYRISLQMDIGLPSQQAFCKTVMVLPPPAFQLPADTSSCSGIQLLLGVNGYPGGIFHWSTGSDSSGTVADTTGKYWVSLSNYGCSASDTVRVAIGITPTVILPKDTMFCDSGTLRYTSLLPVTYAWSTGSDSSATVVSASGQYKLVLNNNGCTAADSSSVMILTKATRELPKDTTWCGPGTLAYTGGAPSLQYAWSTGSNAAAIQITSSGLYWVQLDNQGCFTLDSSLVTVAPDPVVDLGADTAICIGKGPPYILTPGPQPSGTTYQWQDGSTLGTYAVQTAGLFYLRVTSPNGCFVVDSIRVAGVDVPSFTLGGKQPFCEGEVIYLRPGNDSLSYTWQDGSADSVYKVTAPGTYSVVGTNACGSYSDSIQIYPGVCVIRIPNAFTPNGDGINDLFRVLGVEAVEDFQLSIYNRWGQRVFATENKLAGWDGTFHGVRQPPGAYVYDVQFKYIVTGQSYELGGTVTLIR